MRREEDCKPFCVEMRQLRVTAEKNLLIPDQSPGLSAIE